MQISIHLCVCHTDIFMQIDKLISDLVLANNVRLFYEQADYIENNSNVARCCSIG